jgi:hypothetical protein
LAGQPQQSSSAPAHRGGDGGASLVFWLLIALALAVFTPCMILPAWREYQAAELIERTRLGEVAAARAQLASLQRQLHGVREDPMVLARLARRELRAHAPDEAGWRVAPVVPPVTGAGDPQTGFAWASLTPTSAVTSALEPGAHRSVNLARLMLPARRMPKERMRRAWNPSTRRSSWPGWPAFCRRSITTLSSAPVPHGTSCWPCPWPCSPPPSPSSGRAVAARLGNNPRRVRCADHNGAARCSTP